MKRSLQHNRGIAWGDRNETDLYWEEVYKREKKERVYLEKLGRAERRQRAELEKQRVAESANSITAVYTASRYAPKEMIIVWASAVNGKSREVLKGRFQVKVLKHRSLLCVVKTLGVLFGVSGIIYYYDNPKWSEPLEQRVPPMAADDDEKQLWSLLFNLSKERDIKWELVRERKPFVFIAAERLLNKEFAGFAVTR